MQNLSSPVPTISAADGSYWIALSPELTAKDLEYKGEFPMPDKLCDVEIGVIDCGIRIIVSDVAEPAPKLAMKRPANRPYYQRGRW